MIPLLVGLTTSIQSLVPHNQTRVAFASAVNMPHGDVSSTEKIFLPLTAYNPTPEVAWPTIAGNPQRTSWTPAEVSGNLHIEWYRPIEAYISQNVQIIASNGLLYIATARGLYALRASTGDTAWRFDTELPLGNSPTVVNNVVYVGGYDHRLYALNALNGQRLWSFDGAKAGYDTNPLVVDGKVILGNRDGTMYAIGAQGSPNQGHLLWSFKAAGAIHLSAAYKDGVVYFAANDNYAYALDASNGALIWKSDKLPGDGYQSYWPVIYQDKVIFAAASGYRASPDPGLPTLIDLNGEPYGKIFDLERDTILSGVSEGGLIGSPVSGQSWAHGDTVLNGSRISQYLESKPWRRVMIVLNRSNGSEYTYDFDRDGKPEYIPVAMWGTQNGNRYPPIIGPDDILYISNLYQKHSIPQGRVMGWKIDTPYLSLLAGQGAVDEPQAISAGGNRIYRSICCDRVGDSFGILPGVSNNTYWTYDRPLFQQAPGYDQMWWVPSPNDPVRLEGNYGTVNGIYHNHGDQNPIIPYNGRLFIHRSNAIIAYGSGPALGKRPLLTINPVQETLQTPTEQDLVAMLEGQIQKVVDAGHLRPGYYNNGPFQFPHLASYFENPGDTLYTLAISYPYLSPALQQQVKSTLQNEFNTYFNPMMYSTIGWANGAAREAMPLPPEVEAALPTLGPSQRADLHWSWTYPQVNFYAMWKYAQLVPADTSLAYSLAKSKLEVPVPAAATLDYFLQKPYELNGYIAGYIGFLNLQDLAQASTADNALRTQVTSELNRLLQMRSTYFTKDTYWVTERYHYRALNLARNFIMLVPELGDYLHQNALNKVQDAIDEYNFTGPYWFVSRFNAVVNEGVMQHLYDYNAIFLAKAYILQEPREQLTKYLDVPAFERGDLFYIQNLVAAIQAPSSGVQVLPETAPQNGEP